MRLRLSHAAALAIALLVPEGAFAQTAVPAAGTPAVATPATRPAEVPNDPKTAVAKPGQSLHNGPNAATGVSGSGNAGAGGGVAPGQQ